MSDELKEFIETHIDLIDNNQWGDLYRNANFLSDDSIGKLTQIFLSVGIDPLEYLECVPRFYLEYTFSSVVRIPEGITIIGHHSLAFCKIRTLFLPKSLKEISGNAFDGSLIERIIYLGTMNDWSKVQLNGGWKNSLKVNIKCSDGEIKI